MKPFNLSTKIFLDSGDPEDTKKMLGILGFLDGQTTNPSLVAKKLSQGIKRSKDQVIKLTEDQLLNKYRSIVQMISKLVPNGSVSIEVYADKNTTADQMMEQAREMNSWIPNAHIKLPTTAEGLIAAHTAVSEGMRVNLTLIFTQEQAAAVYLATKSDGVGSLVNKISGLSNVFVSPFIGRLDDRGENGMDIVKNISHMFSSSDHHVMNLAASIRSLDHFMGSIASGADIITCPFGILEQWAHDGMRVPDKNYRYDSKNLSPIEYHDLDLTKDWTSLSLSHDLTDAGLQKFAEDWNSLISHNT